MDAVAELLEYRDTLNIVKYVFNDDFLFQVLTLYFSDDISSWNLEEAISEIKKRKYSR